MAILHKGSYISGVSGDTKPTSNISTGTVFVETNTDKIYHYNGSAWDQIIPTSIPNASLTNSTVTIGDSSVALGATDTTLTGLTDLDLTSGSKTIFDGVGSNTLTVGASGTTVALAGNVTIGGTLTVNGATTTNNSTTVTVDDPIFTLGGDTAPSSADTKDRGIEFRYFRSGDQARIGWFGWDNSASANTLGVFTGFTAATNSSEVMSGTRMSGHFNAITADGTITGNLTGNVTGNASGTAATVTTAAQPAITSLGTQAANLNMGSNTIYGVTQLSGSHADGPRIAGDEASSATNPTFIVDRQDMTTGIGGTSTYVSTIVGAAEITRATSTGLALNGNLLADHSNSGGSVYLRAYNESTGSGSAAFVEIRTLGTGDAKTIYMLENVSGSDDVTYSIGLDHSDSDKFKISNSSALGTNDRFTIDSAGKVGIGTAIPDHELHVENSSSNSAPAIKLENDAQGYRLQVNGGDSDKLQLLETSGFDTFFQFDPSTKDVALGVTNNEVHLRGATNFGVHSDGVDVTFFGNTSGVNAVWDASDNRLEFVDDAAISFGDSNDLQIYHDGSNSYIKDAGTGALFVFADTFRVRNAANSEDIVSMAQDGAVELFHNNVKKLETTATGATVTGALDIAGGELKLSTGQSTLRTDNAYIRKHASTGEIHFDSQGSVRVNLDTNDNNTDKLFSIGANASTSNVFSVNENGAVSATGEIKSTVANGWGIGNETGVQRISNNSGTFSMLNSSNAWANVQMAELQVNRKITPYNNTDLQIYGNIEINKNSIATGNPADMENITFRKQHPTAGAGYQYNLARLQAYTTGGYSGGIKFFTGIHQGGGSYGLAEAFRIDETAQTLFNNHVKIAADKYIMPMDIDGTTWARSLNGHWTFANYTGNDENGTSRTENLSLMTWSARHIRINALYNYQSESRVDGDFRFIGANYNAIWDKSDNALEFVDGAKLQFGTGGDLVITHASNETTMTLSNSEPLRVVGSTMAVTPAANPANNPTYRQDEDFNVVGATEGVIQVSGWGNTGNAWQTVQLGAGINDKTGGTTVKGFVGTLNDANFGLMVNDSIRAQLETDGDFHVDGDVYAFSGSVSSDIALKENINIVDNALDKVSKLRGVSFDWKREGKGSSIGLIAQDVEPILPELVSEAPTFGDSTDTHKTLNYNGIIGLLVESIKELKEELSELKNADR